MKKLLIIFLALAALLLREECHGQGTVKYTAGISYGIGAPTYTPQGNVSKKYINLTTLRSYTWAGAAWVIDGQGIDVVSGCAAPAYTPGIGQSNIVINNCTEAQNGQGPELYAFDGTAWIFINEKTDAPTYTAGTGIDITGDVITNTGDLSSTNELQTLSSGTNTVTLSNSGGTVTVDTDPANDITSITAGTGISVSGTGDTRTVTNTAPDQVVTITGATGSYPNFTIPSPAVTLNDITDVTLSSPTNNQILQYNTATTQWVNATLAAITGSGTAGYISKWATGSSLDNSGLYQLTTKIIGFNTTTPTVVPGWGGGVALNIHDPSGLPNIHLTSASNWGGFALDNKYTYFITRSGMRFNFNSITGQVLPLEFVNSYTVAMQIDASNRVSIGTTSPSASAKLDVTSTTQGVLFPRMTTTQRDAIASPPDGLVIYNTTANKLQVRAASAWVDLH